MRSLGIAAIAACASLLFRPGQAGAVVVSGTFSGIIQGADTIDTVGLFGPANADLTGETITGSYTYDTSLAISPSIIHPTLNQYRLGVVGGIEVSVTVGAVTLTTLSTDLNNTSSEVSEMSDGADTHTYFSALDSSGNVVNFVGLSLGAFVSGSTINAPFVPDPSAIWTATAGNLASNGQGDDLTFVPNAAVPEPASLVLLGTCAAGIAALRRRRV